MNMKKVLYVCGQEFILDKKDGGKQCSYRNYCMLQDVYGTENVYACIFSNEFTASDSHVKRMRAHHSLLGKIKDVFLLRSFYSIESESKLLSYIKMNKFDMVFFERSMFGTLVKKLKKSNIETQVFVQNIEKNYVWNKVKKQGIWFVLPYISTKINEKMTFRYCDSIICLTERDNGILRELYNRSCDAVIPMTYQDGFDDKILPNAKDNCCNTKELLFIGSYFPPNYDGIEWFVKNVMSKLPEYTLLIIGKNFERKKDELQQRNVKVIGTVDNLDFYYCMNAAIVMPILYGDGMKTKTAEAMMYGKTIFASDEALVGYDVEDVKGIYRCNTVSEYITKIREVYEKETAVGYIDDVRNQFLKKYENSNASKIYRTHFCKGYERA